MRSGTRIMRGAAIAATVLALSACSSSPRPSGNAAGTVTPRAGATDGGYREPGSATAGSTKPPRVAWNPTSTTRPALIAVKSPTCPRVAPDAAVPVPAALEAPLADLSAHGDFVAVSASVDGGGTVISLNASVPTQPASNQKLAVAFAVLESLPVDGRLTTTIITTGPTVDGTVQGDIVLIAGGDPTLTRAGPHSLDTLAAQVRARGITGATGSVLIDDSRYDSQTSVPGWPASNWPSVVGAVNALVVDRNKIAPDVKFFSDPVPHNAQLFGDALLAAGITVNGAPTRGTAPAGDVVASTDSPTFGELVTSMLSQSENLTAELLLKELGMRRSGSGTTTAGLAAMTDAVTAACAPVDGSDADGSGFSPADTRSAQALRGLLVVARTRPWGPTFVAALPVAGQSGTLGSRLLGGNTAGRVHAKTGATAEARALSGYLTTIGGKQVTFAILVRTPKAETEKAIDAFVTAMAVSL